MPVYTVAGTDSITRQPSSMSVDRPTLADAAKFAESRGLVPETITGTDGQVNRLVGGVWVHDRLATIERIRSAPVVAHTTPAPSDTPLYVWSMLIPVAGIIAGAIRLANRDPSGAGVLGVSLLGVIGWGVAVGVVVAQLIGGCGDANVHGQGL